MVLEVQSVLIIEVLRTSLLTTWSLLSRSWVPRSPTGRVLRACQIVLQLHSHSRRFRRTYGVCRKLQTCSPPEEDIQPAGEAAQERSRFWRDREGLAEEAFGQMEKLKGEV